MKGVLVFTVVLLLLSVPLKAQELIPCVQAKEAKVQLYGFSQGYFENRADPEAQWPLARLYMRAERGDSVSAFIQTQLITGGNISSDWLKQIFVGYKLKELKEWTLRAGRVFVAGGYTTPAPCFLETVRFPRIPARFFGYGIQTQGEIPGGLGILVDMTGKTDQVFYEKSNFDRMEFSGRITKGANDLTFALTTQLSKDFALYVLDLSHKLTEKLKYKGAVYRCGEEIEGVDNKSHGGYVFIGFMPLEWLEVHSQFDYRRIDPEETRIHRRIWTNGIRAWSAQDNLALTIDYVSDKHRVLGRLQFRF